MIEHVTLLLVVVMKKAILLLKMLAISGKLDQLKADCMNFFFIVNNSSP